MELNDLKDLNGLIDIDNCIRYYGTNSLIKSMGTNEALSNINDLEIISYLEKRGYKIKKND